MCVCVSGPRTRHGKDLGAFIFFPSAFNLMCVGVYAQFTGQFHTRLACKQGEICISKGSKPEPDVGRGAWGLGMGIR